MPEGPWIRRNPYGVVFTEDVIPAENSVSLGDTFRQVSEISDSNAESSVCQEE